MPTQASTPTHDRVFAVPYRRTGSYIKGQRVAHPRFGLGTVIRVKTGKVIILFDDPQERPDRPGREKGERVFLAAKLSLSQRRIANKMGLNESLPAYDIGLDEASEEEEVQEVPEHGDPAEAYDDVDEVA
ncbi:hypothetical protein [Geothrix fermentans]|uniref:hypothetical protein n=1 Tax=Geothrix fermentans TaxID=44676 RepID=UPI00047E0C52|nr:hypothetical protein [Geothrix fermentans]